MIPAYPFYPTCFECGGHIELTCKHGRTRELVYGHPLPIPEEIPIPTCDGCGDEVWTPELSEYLDGILAQ